MTLKIGILNADNVRPELESVYGNYPFMFTQMLKNVEPGVTTVIYNVMDGEYPADINEVDAFFVTGSKFSVYDNEPWIHKLGDFIIKLHENKKKLVAICFGHQMVAHFLGGKTEKSMEGWTVGVQQCEINGLESPIFLEGETFRLLASHQDQVAEIAKEAKTIASSEYCPHVMTQIGNHTLTLQWHPEFNKDYVEQLLHIRREILGEELYQGAIKSLDEPIDNSKFARRAIDFIRS